MKGGGGVKNNFLMFLVMQYCFVISLLFIQSLHEGNSLRYINSSKKCSKSAASKILVPFIKVDKKLNKEQWDGSLSSDCSLFCLYICIVFLYNYY